MRKMLIILAMVALTCCLPGPAAGDYVSNFTVAANWTTSIPPAPYGTIDVGFSYLGSDYAAVSITFAPGFALNVGQGIYLSLAAGEAFWGYPSAYPGWLLIPTPGSYVVSGIGSFNEVLTYTGLLGGGPGGGPATSFDFILYDPSGWTSAAVVLGVDSQGYIAAAALTYNGTATGDVGAVPLPPSMWLLGTGILGLAAVRLRVWKGK